MGRIKKYLINGGGKSIIEMGVQLIVYFFVLAFLMGQAITKFRLFEERISKLEHNQECLEEIKIRLTALEQNQQRILEILQGRYK